MLSEEAFPCSGDAPYETFVASGQTKENAAPRSARDAQNIMKDERKLPTDGPDNGQKVNLTGERRPDPDGEDRGTNHTDNLRNKTGKSRNREKTTRRPEEHRIPWRSRHIYAEATWDRKYTMQWQPWLA